MTVPRGERAAGAFRVRWPAAKSGWGGRDRTYECRNQNPVPYHLATPQRKTGACRTPTEDPDPYRTVPKVMRNRPAGAARACARRTRRTRAARRQRRARRRPVPNSANTQAPEPVIRACGRMLGKRLQRLGDGRKAAPTRPAADRSGHNPRKRLPFSPTRVFRVNSGAAKTAAVGTATGGIHDRHPQLRQRHRRQPLADAARERRRAERRRTGTSAPSVAPIARQRSRGSPSPRAGSAPAAPTPRRSCRRPVRRPAGSA